MRTNPCITCQIGCPGRGCKEWEDWFTENWNHNIHREVPPVPKQVWQHEHPDRAREMDKEVADAQ